MTSDPLPEAARVRKARRSSRVACGHFVLTGQVIVMRSGRWLCLPCGLATIGKRPASPATAPPSTEGDQP